MSTDAIAVALAVLTLVTALNLILTLRLARAGQEVGSGAKLLQPGQPLPAVRGASADGRDVGTSEFDGRAAVILFMSAGCGKCRDKIGDIVRVRARMRDAGIVLWIVPMDPRHGVGSLVEGTVLTADVVEMNEADRRALNPLDLVPLYIFANAEGRVEASNQIGDANWLSFLGQLSGED